MFFIYYLLPFVLIVMVANIVGNYRRTKQIGFDYDKLRMSITIALAALAFIATLIYMYLLMIWDGNWN